MTATWNPTEECSVLQRILNLLVLTVMNMYRLSIAWMLSDFTNSVGKILLLITQEQVGNCSSDVNGVILDSHQYRREHNLMPWMLSTKAWLYYPMIWLWQPVSLNWCLTQLPWESMWAFALIKMLSVEHLGSQIWFWIKVSLTYFDWNSCPRWCWPNCHLIWPHFDCHFDLLKAVQAWNTLSFYMAVGDIAKLLSISPTSTFSGRKTLVLGNFRHYLTIVLAYLSFLPYVLPYLIMLQRSSGQAPNPRKLASQKECFQDFSPVNTGVQLGFRRNGFSYLICMVCASLSHYKFPEWKW